MGEMKIKTAVAGCVSALPLAVGAAVKAGDDDCHRRGDEDGNPGIRPGVGNDQGASGRGRRDGARGAGAGDHRNGDASGPGDMVEPSSWSENGEISSPVQTSRNLQTSAALARRGRAARKPSAAANSPGHDRSVLNLRDQVRSMTGDHRVGGQAAKMVFSITLLDPEDPLMLARRRRMRPYWLRFPVLGAAAAGTIFPPQNQVRISCQAALAEAHGSAAAREMPQPLLSSGEVEFAAPFAARESCIRPPRP